LLSPVHNQLFNLENRVTREFLRVLRRDREVTITLPGLPLIRATIKLDGEKIIDRTHRAFVIALKFLRV